MTHRYKVFASSAPSLTCGRGRDRALRLLWSAKKVNHLGTSTLESPVKSRLQMPSLCRTHDLVFPPTGQPHIKRVRAPRSRVRSEQLPAHNLTQSRVSRIASAAAKFLHFEQVYRCRRRHEYERVLFFRAARETACLGGE